MFRKPEFWTGVADAVFSLALYFATKYLAPTYVEDVKILLVAIQPIVGMIILGMLEQRAEALIRSLR